MHQKKAVGLLILMQAVVITLTAQQPDTASAAIDFKLENNKATFHSSLRPLRQIAGAPEAFFTHFWEFGDGKFSFEPNPVHFYKDTGIYDVLYYATNNYDDGKPPPRRRKKVPVKNKVMYAQQNTPSFFKSGDAIEMKVNRMPKPEEEMVLIIGYRNQGLNASLDGSLVLFYNERQFKAKNFEIAEERAYYGEKTSSLSSIAFLENEITGVENMLTGSGPNVQPGSDNRFFAGRFADLLKIKQQVFTQSNVWSFENLQQGEEKYFFLTLYTTPEMIKDTNAVVVLNGMFVPNDPNGEIEEYELELQIVASHDPNRMMLRNRRLNYRFTGSKKEMTYRVQFQNTGKGPASQISVGVKVPSMLDAKSLEITDQYPECIPCDSAGEGQSCLDTLITKDSIYFIFKNIYLPGLRQMGFSDPDSAYGFVKYRLQFGKKLKKLPFESNASIIFDNNKPVITNTARGYFKPGISPGIIAGYNKWLNIGGKDIGGEDYWMLGASVSSYSPYKKYLQGELLVSTLNHPEQLVEVVQNRDTIIDGRQYFLLFMQTFEKRKVYNLHLVPLQLRYNFLDFIAAGAGTMISLDAITRSSFYHRMQLIPQAGGPPEMREDRSTKTKSFSGWDAAVFADLQLGKVRTGPALGFRFLHYFRTPQNRLLIYATWRL